MKKLLLVILLISFSVPLFAKTHNGTFKLMDYRRGANNTFDTTIEVKYSLDSLMGEPVVKAQARYSVMGLVNINGKRLKLSREQLNKLKIYNLKLTVPFETKAIPRRLFIDINMGAMGTPGKWSYNTPGSPNWNKWIMDENGDYLSKEKAIKAYKGFQRLGVSSGLGSLAEVKSIKFNVSGTKTKAKKAVLKNVWVDKSTGLMWQNEVYSNSEEKVFKKGSSNYKKVGHYRYALQYCKKLSLSNFTNWRLPAFEELKKLRNYKNKVNYARHTYISIESGKPSGVSFKSGKLYKSNIYKDKWNGYIRCVRD